MNGNALFALCAAALFSGCASAPRLAEGRSGTISLPGFAPRTGGHCESSAMLNALSYLGYDVTEADIAGGGGAPAFIFTNAGFPFIGGRNERMRENFLDAAKIPYHVVVPDDPNGGWDEIVALLDRGIPVLLRVDMRWLPYLYGGAYGDAHMSFGWHVICLYGIDFDTREAVVTDTGLGGPCHIALADLEKARSSKTKVYPPRREFAWIEAKPAEWVFAPDAVKDAALDTVLANYDVPGAWVTASGATASPDTKGAPLSGLAGLAAFPEVLASLHTVVNPHIIAAAYAYMGDTIERNGTGGAAFRRFFRDFLAARATDCADPGSRLACAALLPAAEAARAAWSALAGAFYESSAAIGAAKGAQGKAAAIEAAEAVTAKRARELLAAESALRDAIAASR